MGNFPPFHVQLKYERECRGWSQADVASKVGTEPKTVARWEGGKSRPRPYHRQALCELFGKNAEEFGLVSEQKDIPPPVREETEQLQPTAEVSSSPSIQAKAYQNIVGFPPPTSPETIEQREKDVENIYEQLLQVGTTAMVLTGISGVGKSTLAALVYRFASEHYRVGENLLHAPPLWLTINENVTMSDLVGTLLETNGKPLPNLESFTPHSQVMMLFNMLNTGNEARLIILDQFENVLDWQTGYALAERPGVGEWLDVLNSQPSSCKFLLTSCPWPRGSREYPPTYMHEYPVKGLNQAEGVELLRKQGVRPEQATDLQLQTAVVRCNGHGFALTFLASLLRRNRSLTLSLLFENPLYSQMWDGDIAHNLLDYIYLRQLDDMQRKVLFAFSIYREPVPLEAASMVVSELNAQEQKARIPTALPVLLRQHLLKAQGNGLYQLHIIIANYVRENSSGMQKEEIVRSAHERAATYYFAQPGGRKLPRAQRKEIADVHSLIEGIWHLCQAEQWQEAYGLMQREEIYPDLRRWGGNATLLELYQLLLPLEKWQPTEAQQAEIWDHLGRIYGTLGKKELALEYYERALHICRAVDNRQGEGRTLNHIASVQENLGRTELARDLHEKALAIVRTSGDRKGEADSLSGLAWIAHVQGQQEKALRYYEQALHIYQETSNHIGEGNALSGIGLIRQLLGEKENALRVIEQALRLRRACGDRAGEGRTLNTLGLLYADLEQDERAYECYQQSFALRKETGDRNGEGVIFYNVGKLYFNHERYSLALACWRQAAHIFEEVRSTYLKATQKWLTVLQQAVGEEKFLTLLAEEEHQPPQVIEQKVLKGAYLS